MRFVSIFLIVYAFIFFGCSEHEERVKKYEKYTQTIENITITGCHPFSHPPTIKNNREESIRILLSSQKGLYSYYYDVPSKGVKVLEKTGSVLENIQIFFGKDHKKILLTPFSCGYGYTSIIEVNSPRITVFEEGKDPQTFDRK